MKVRPLEVTTLHTLPPAARVYVERRGLVFVYPAEILLDIANNLFIGEEPWRASDDDWTIGRALSRRTQGDDELAAEVAKEDVEAIWSCIRPDCGAFDLWWESVDPDAAPSWIGAAAAVAARELMTMPLFRLRHEVDESEMTP